MRISKQDVSAMEAFFSQLNDEKAPIAFDRFEHTRYDTCTQYLFSNDFDKMYTYKFILTSPSVLTHTPKWGPLRLAHSMYLIPSFHKYENS